MAHTIALSRGLGWFSIGLGLVELLYGRALGRALGMHERTGLLRGFGARELGTGAAILTDPANPAWLWARVGGDGLDLAILASALSPDNPKRQNVALAIVAVAGVTVLDAICARDLQRSR